MKGLGLSLGLSLRQASQEEGLVLPGDVDPIVWWRSDYARVGTTIDSDLAIGTDSVAFLQDLSGNGNHGIQPTSSLRPTFSEAGGLGGISGISFTTDDVIPLTLEASQAPPWEVWCVALVESSPSGLSKYLYDLVPGTFNRGGTFVWVTSSTDISYVLSAGLSESSSGIQAGGTGVFPYQAVTTGIAAASSYQFKEAKTPTSSPTSFSGTPVTIASLLLGNSPALSDSAGNVIISEFFILNGNSSASQLTALKTYLSDRYGISFDW